MIQEIKDVVDLLDGIDQKLQSSLSKQAVDGVKQDLAKAWLKLSPLFRVLSDIVVRGTLMQGTFPGAPIPNEEDVSALMSFPFRILALEVGIYKLQPTP